MINVILNGQLGNILFQYAVGKHLAVKNNTNIKFITYVNRNNIPDRKEIKQLLSVFAMGPISYSSMIHEVIGKRIGIQWPFSKDKVQKEKSWGFYPEVLTVKDGVYLDGCFHSSISRRADAMLRRPPAGMASRAFTARFIST